MPNVTKRKKMIWMRKEKGGQMRSDLSGNG